METGKKISAHRQLVVFFSDTALATRGFRPKITAKDARLLKNALDLNIFNQDDFEQIMLYFLADKSYRNLGPSIATMLSSTVLNSLRNKALNRAQFYKELDSYVMRLFRNKQAPQKSGVKVNRGFVSMADMLQELANKMTLNKSAAPRAPVEPPRSVSMW